MTYQEAARLLSRSGERVLIRGEKGKAFAIDYWCRELDGWNNFCQVDDEDNVSPEAERNLLDLFLERPNEN